jgi:hypothetical protein
LLSSEQVISLVQNIFGKNAGFRDISINSHYIFLMKNPRERNQCVYLARQVLPENPNFIREAFADATRREYGYFLFDMTQKTNDLLRFRTNIFSSDIPQNIIYVQKDANISEFT